MNDPRTAAADVDRRHFLKRAAVVSAGAAWTAPTIQSLVSPAFALGSPAPSSCARLTGGGAITGGVLTTRKGKTKKFKYIGIAVGDLPCGAPPGTDPQITVVAYPKGKKRRVRVFHFNTLQSLTCSTVRPRPGHCPNRFVGSATGYFASNKRRHNHSLSFQLEDHGAGSRDLLSVVITGPKISISATGTLVYGDLQGHCDC